MACDPQTFPGITAEVWNLIRSEVQHRLGITPAGETGRATEKGFTIGWIYDPAAQALTISCIEKPFFVPCGVINAQIAKLIDQARNAAV